MPLTESDRIQYEHEGYLLVPDVFSPDEVATLKEQIPVELSIAGPRAVMERDGKTVRAIHGSHATNHIFNRLSQHPRLVSPAEQVLGSRVYVHQFKINVKAAFVGDIWKWHQDFIFWLKQDGMREPRAINAMVFLDDVTEFNGPLYVVPRSHRLGVIDVPSGASDREVGWRSSFVDDVKFRIDRVAL